MAEARAGAFIEALHRLEEEGEPDALVSMFSEDAELQNPTDAEPHRGRDGARKFWDAYRRSFREIHSEFRNVAEAGDAVLLEWTSRGRLTDGGTVEYDGVSVVEYSEDRIGRFRTYFDPLALGNQITRPTR